MSTTPTATTTPSAEPSAVPSDRVGRPPGSPERSTPGHPSDHRRPHGRSERFGERGQGTVEYALILLGAAAVALVVVAWVTRTDLIGRLFDTVVGSILRQVT